MRLSIATAMAFVLVVTATARASDAARQFQLGVEAERGGRDAQARIYYLKAYENLPTGPVAANLGLVEARLGEWVAAAEHLTHALEQPLGGSARDLLEDALGLALERVGALDITVSPETAAVQVDGVDVAPRHEPLVAFVEPGTCEIRAHQDGFAPVTVEVTVTAGQRVKVRLILQERQRLAAPVAAAPTKDVPAARPASSDEHGTSGTAVLIGGGALTAAALGVGTAFALSARTSQNEADNIRAGFEPDPNHSHCARTEDPECDRLLRELQKADRQLTAAYWSFIAAGALAAGTIVTYVLVRRRNASVRVSPTASGLVAALVF